MGGQIIFNVFSPLENPYSQATVHFIVELEVQGSSINVTFYFRCVFSPKKSYVVFIKPSYRTGQINQILSDLLLHSDNGVMCMI